LIKLIVSADDVGLARGITAGALEAHARGIVTSLSVMTAVHDWDPAGLEGVDVGVHLTLCEGRSVLSPDRIPSLVDASGAFPTDFGQVVRRVASGHVDRSELKAEWIAQVQRAREAGLSISHLDGHKHVHVMPGLGRVALEVRRATGVPGFRLPMQRGGERRAVRTALTACSLRLRGALRRTGGQSADRTVGLGCAGRLTTDTLVALLRGLGRGTTELVAHPGLDGVAQELESQGLDWGAGYRFSDELAALTSDAAREAIDRRGIELVSWADVVN
jgi:predicted glycoside hydrolase/deacetylase ChbG (UPF0249 family)